jgi:hypothetical protein
MGIPTPKPIAIPIVVFELCFKVIVGDENEDEVVDDVDEVVDVVDICDAIGIRV